MDREWCMEAAAREAAHGDPEIGAGLVALDPDYAQTNCTICGRFTDRHGACANVFQVDPGIWEHA